MSFTTRVQVRFADVDRLRAKAVLVCMDLVAQQAVPWPDDLRAAIASDVAAPPALPATTEPAG